MIDFVEFWENVAKFVIPNFERRNPNLGVLNDFLIPNIKIKMIFNIFKLQMFVTFSVFLMWCNFVSPNYYQEILDKMDIIDVTIVDFSKSLTQPKPKIELNEF